MGYTTTPPPPHKNTYDDRVIDWPSRDPIQERGGVNLYAFVGNNPIYYWDLLGLFPVFPGIPTPFLLTTGALPPSSSPSATEHMGLTPVIGDQTDWFNNRFPNLIEAAKEKARNHVEIFSSDICKTIAEGGLARLTLNVFMSVHPMARSDDDFIQGAALSNNTFMDSDFGDAQQSWYDAYARLGSFSFRVPDQVMESDLIMTSLSPLSAGTSMETSLYQVHFKMEAHDGVGPDYLSRMRTRGSWDLSTLITCYKCVENDNTY